MEPLEHKCQKLEARGGSRSEFYKRMTEHFCSDNLKRRCDPYFLGDGFGKKKKQLEE